MEYVVNDYVNHSDKVFKNNKNKNVAKWLYKRLNKYIKKGINAQLAIDLNNNLCIKLG